VTTPVFFDPSGKRRRAVNRSSTFLGLGAAVLTTVFVVSLLVVPFLPQFPGMANPARQLTRAGQALLPKRSQRLTRQLLRKSRIALFHEIAASRAPGRRRTGPAPIAARPDTTIAAFYAIWQRSGLYSLRLNADRLTDLFPEWLHLTRAGTALDFKDWDPEVTQANLEVVEVAREHHIDIHPVLNNAERGRFDPDRAHVLLSSSQIQLDLAHAVRDWLVREEFQGLNLDLENLRPGDYARLPRFVALLRSVLHPAGLQLSVDVEAARRDLPLEQLAAAADKVILMSYAQHAAAGNPGPIAAVQWFDSVLARTLQHVPASKLVVGIGNYGLDWPSEGKPPTALTYQQALFIAQDNHPDERPQQVVDFDPVELNPTFQYLDDSSKTHEVWMLDAATAYNGLLLARRSGVKGAALWVLGSEDPSLWAVYDRRTVDALPAADALDTIPPPYAPIKTGTGDVLDVVSSPHGGLRTTDADSGTGLITDEEYANFPSPYVIQHSGYKPKKLVLTFDDGPDRVFTPEVLDVLKDLGVKATFFLIGENVERYPEITRRILREGHEIGSHTFTHPNMGEVSHRRVLLELNTTQRALEAVLGRSTILFRFPYNADQEPNTNEETDPVLVASRLGYITVGELIDPQDWNLFKTDSAGDRAARTADDLVESVVTQADSMKGNVILLHSGGGDRRATVRALPALVRTLQDSGYQFITIAQLIGVPTDVVMPAVSRNDELLVGLDRVSFNTVFTFETILGATFIFAVILAVGRVVFILPIALLARRKARHAVFDPAYRPSVSVLIAAFNERPVIARTVHSVLANDYPGLEVIVVDDGSTDGTGAAVEAEFGSDPRVRLISQPNAGKAAALNRGIQDARGEIMVCFDADTQIAPLGIALIVRHFQDARVGAVAGNVKVGNRINVLTRWQSIEYISSQNLDRRAYAYLNAITVVPGAVGAWRRTALVAVGGYLNDTMAEDMELTYRLRRAGWRITADVETLGYTEAPATFRAFFRQRFRWAYGTLQCLWKHRGALFRYGWFGGLAIPAVWIFQVVFQALGPLVDLKVVWTLIDFVYSWATLGALHQDWQPLPGITRLVLEVGFFYGIFFGVDLIGAFVAYWLDRERYRDLWWLFWQRFVYRQVMYAVLWKSVVTAIKGKRQGWGKQERKGTVHLAAGTA
jgi:cellulose synthase/poly-beta-1,6-N-acetylglucosamine synthase-like glycosyltransferase/peptidoglycan/xylan/chitin deacetylase (PgdA/CDA1 family)